MKDQGLHYYLYISRNKLRMLAPQLPERRRVEVSAKLKLGAAPVGAEVSAATTLGIERGEHEALRAVADVVRKYEAVGPIDSSNAWIEDSMDARWGLYPSGDPRLVFFGGLKQQILLGLTGSPSSVVALAERAPAALATASIEFGFMDVMAEIEGRKANWTDRPQQGTPDLFDSVEQMVREFLAGGTHRIGFLAKRLSSGKSSRQTPVVLATPLFVELL